MDFVFACPFCQQELETDSSLAGSAISCPTCAKEFTVPVAPASPPPPPLKIGQATTGSVPPHPAAPAAPAHEHDKHFVVPMTDKPTASLIQKPNAPLTAAPKDGKRRMMIKCIRRVDCMEVGKDHFDEKVTLFLTQIGEENFITMSTIMYTTIDMASRSILTDYGVMITYRG